MHTLVLAGAVTWLAVALSMHFLDPGHVLLGWILLLVFLAAFLSEILLREGHAWLRGALLVVEPVAALALMGLDAGPGTAQVLLIVWITQVVTAWPALRTMLAVRSEEHTSELQSLMRISYAVFCLKKKKTPISY